MSALGVVMVIMVVMVLEEERRQHWKTYSLAPGRGFLDCTAQLVREGKELAITRHTYSPRVKPP